MGMVGKCGGYRYGHERVCSVRIGCFCVPQDAEFRSMSSINVLNVTQVRVHLTHA